MMVTLIMSKMLKMNDVQREDFSEELENLREVIRSVLTVCGERLVSLSDLWTLLTACRCLQDQVLTWQKSYHLRAKSKWSWTEIQVLELPQLLRLGRLMNFVFALTEQFFMLT